MHIKTRYTWRKRPTRDGMMRLAPSYMLHRGDGVVLATAQKDERTGMWFWYGGGKNTAGMQTDLETAKREALAYISTVKDRSRD